ncbi:MAG: tetratricopeptide repeat protein [Bacteroidetes bacterium]|nr:tetratricopeptide repeat protein [Bacteroidota bacterium]
MSKKNLREKTAAVPKAKEIGTTKLVYLILGLGFVGMIILYSTDTFQTPKAIQNFSGSQNQNMNDPHAGANLSNLQEIKRLEGIVNANPNDLSTLVKLAHLLNDSGFFPKAIENYKKYLAQKPNDADVIVDMGVCYFETKDFNTAIATMKSALKVNPTHQIAHFNLGIVNFSAGNLNEAISWWKKTIEINPISEVAVKAKELINQHSQEK